MSASADYEDEDDYDYENAEYHSTWKESEPAPSVAQPLPLPALPLAVGGFVVAAILGLLLFRGKKPPADPRSHAGVIEAHRKSLRKSLRGEPVQVHRPAAQPVLASRPVPTYSSPAPRPSPQPARGPSHNVYSSPQQRTPAPAPRPSPQPQQRQVVTSTPKQGAAMSWQEYVDQYLMAAGLQSAAIVGLDGGIWAASPAFRMEPAEISAVVAAFNDPGALAAAGLFINRTKYMVVQGDPGNVIRGKKGASGVTIKRTLTAMVVGLYGENLMPGQASVAVEDLGDYLKGQSI